MTNRRYALAHTRVCKLTKQYFYIVDYMKERVVRDLSDYSNAPRFLTVE